MIKYILVASGIVLLGGCSTLTLTEQNLKVCQSEEDKISGCIAKTMLDGGEYYEVPYKNGVKEGVAIFYYADGKRKGEIPLKNGDKEGVEKWYYENGNLDNEILFSNGKVEE